MATITTTTSLSFDAAASLTVGVDKNFDGSIAFTSANDDVWPSFTVTKPQSKTYGPFGIAMTVVITVGNGSLDYTINGGVGGFGYDTDGNVTSLVSGDGTNLTGSLWVQPSGDTTGVADTANILAAIASAEASVAAGGGVANVVLVGSDYYTTASLVIKNGIRQDFPTPAGADMTYGVNLMGLKKGITRLHVLTEGIQGVLIYCPTASSHLMNAVVSGMTIFGPGGSNDETVGLQIGGVNVNATEDVMVQDVSIQNFVVGLRTENVCNATFRRVEFGDYTRGVEFGYNSDTFLFDECRWGDENAVTNAGTALYFNYISGLRSGSIGLAISAHRYVGCWFMRQTLVANIYQPSTNSILFDTCYYERCTQYATIGNTGVATGVKGVTWDNCHFSQPNDATETKAKIETQHANDTSTITIRNCRTDDATGPQIALVKIGYATALRWEMNEIPAVGGQILNETGRYFSYTKFETADLGHGTRVAADHTLNGGLPVHLVEVHNPSYSSGSESTLAAFRNTAKGNGATNSSGNVITLASDTVAWSGAVRSRRTAALPTATSQWEGVVITLQGGAGVASTLNVCLKSSGDTYSWKVVSTG